MRRLRGMESAKPFERYRYQPTAYIEKYLNWSPWSGTEEYPGQQQIIDAYTLAIRQQHERADFESGKVSESELTVWKPGQVIQNRIRVEAGHTVGKTKTLSGLVNHFFDCFPPSIIYTFAPSWEQIHDLLWKEVKDDRRDKGLPGRILDLQLIVGDKHFAKGRATNNANNQGTERIQGQHGAYLMFVLDEAEGIADYVYQAIDSMSSGGISIILLAANPKSRTSLFYKVRELSVVRNFRISCVNHPNVVSGREIVPNSVRRDYVEGMIESCALEVVAEHNPDDHTFELPWRPGLIYKPDAEFMFRILGVAPSNISGDTLIPPGRYEAACKRVAVSDRPEEAWIGIDAAGFGNDLGTGYIRHNGRVWRSFTASKPNGDQDPSDYFRKTKADALKIHSDGVKRLSIRIDAGGGFGNGLFSLLSHDDELKRTYQSGLRLQMVHFGGVCYNEDKYANMGTQLYAESAEALKGLAIVKPPPTLEGDLCERRYVWTNKAGVEVKRLEEKKVFHKEKGRSPDDGDGFVLCVAPDFVFNIAKEVVYEPLWHKATPRR